MSIITEDMEFLQRQREVRGLSQRRLAKMAGLSFRAVQLLEWGEGDPQISTLKKVASSLGYPARAFQRYLKRFFKSPPDSIVMISERLLENGEAEWKGWLFNFVDRFRENPTSKLIEVPPCLELSDKMRSLLVSTVEALCFETNTDTPEWCSSVPPLQEPWFVSEMESLKPSVIVESPVFFRKRNIFVLKNFLERI